MPIQNAYEEAVKVLHITRKDPCNHTTSITLGRCRMNIKMTTFANSGRLIIYHLQRLESIIRIFCFWF